MECCSGLSLLGALIGLWILYKLCDMVYRWPSIPHKPSDLHILITGCGSGFGYELVRRLDSLGCHVYAGCRAQSDEARLRKVCSDRLVTLTLDLRSADSVRRAYDAVTEKLPTDKGLWAVVNNAGILGLVGREEWITLDDYRDVLEVNTLGMINIAMTFLPLVKRARGRVVNMSSMGGRFSLSPFVPYSVSKFAIEAFSDGLRRSLHVYGCKVIVLEPGMYRTRFVTHDNTHSLMKQAWSQATPDVQREFGEQFLHDALRDLNMLDLLMSARISDVIDAYQHALLSRHPRARYVVGWDAHWVWWWVVVLPEWIADWLLRAANPHAAVPAALKD